MRNLEGQLSDYKTNVASLNKKLELLKTSSAAGEKNLQRFQRKLSRIRISLTKEVDKVSEYDFALSANSTRDNHRLELDMVLECHLPMPY